MRCCYILSYCPKSKNIRFHIRRVHPKTNHTRYTLTHIKKLLTHSSVHVHTCSRVRISFPGSQRLCLHPEYAPLHIARAHTHIHTHTLAYPSTNAHKHVCSCMCKHSLHACILSKHTYSIHTRIHTSGQILNHRLYQFGSQSPLNIVFRDPKQGTRDTHEWIAWSRHTHPN